MSTALSDLSLAFAYAREASWCMRANKLDIASMKVATGAQELFKFASDANEISRLAEIRSIPALVSAIEEIALRNGLTLDAVERRSRESGFQTFRDYVRFWFN